MFKLARLAIILRKLRQRLIPHHGSCIMLSAIRIRHTEHRLLKRIIIRVLCRRRRSRRVLSLLRGCKRQEEEREGGTHNGYRNAEKEDAMLCTDR